MFGKLRLSEISPLKVTRDLKQTKGFLGHSSIGITSDVYVHLQPHSEVESMKKLEETLFGELCSTVLKTGVEGQKGMVNEEKIS